MLSIHIFLINISLLKALLLQGIQNHVHVHGDQQVCTKEKLGNIPNFGEEHNKQNDKYVTSEKEARRKVCPDLKGRPIMEIDSGNINNKSKHGEVLFKVGTCHNGATLIDVTFITKESHYPLYTVCHDEKIDATYYSSSYILGRKLDSAEKGQNRPQFLEDHQFFKEIHADKSYSKKGQLKSIGELLGSKKLAEKYIKLHGNDYFARGHLYPNADPILGTERQATFYYINTFPQWQPINSGNWNYLEAAARKLAQTAKGNLTIWTGTYGNLELPDENKKMVEIWLGRDNQGNFVTPKRLPIPYFMWKVIYYEKCHKAVVIIQINNPWADVSSKSPICESKCDQISWIKWNKEDMHHGYTFCCDAQTFHKIVSYAPKFSKKIKLLTEITAEGSC